MPELSFAVGEEDVVVLEGEVRPGRFAWHEDEGRLSPLEPQAATAAEDAKDIELRNQRKVRMSRLQQELLL